MNIEKLEIALKLLNNVETKGSINLNNLLGAIQLVEKFKQELSLTTFPVPGGAENGDL